MIRRPPRATQGRSSAASDVYKRQIGDTIRCEVEVIEITDKGKDAGVLTVRNRIVNQKDETAATFVMKLFCGKRPA